MTCTGVVRGKTIVLDRPVPFEEGQQVCVDLVAVEVDELPLGSPRLIRRAMHDGPHVSADDVAELQKLIEQGMVSTDYEGVFGQGSNV